MKRCLCILAGLTVLASVGLCFYHSDTLIARYAPGRTAEKDVAERWENLVQSEPLLAKAKFVSADISGRGYDEQKKGTPVSGTYKVLLGSTAKEYPVTGFVSSERASVVLDMSSANDVGRDLIRSLSGAELKEFFIAGCKDKILTDRRSATIHYMANTRSDEEFKAVIIKSLEETAEE